MLAWWGMMNNRYTIDTIIDIIIEVRDEHLNKKKKL